MRSYFKKPLNIYLGFIPEIIFMSSLFGYLALLVFYKWTAYDAKTSMEAPSILISFINMFLFNYNDNSTKQLYKGQVSSHEPTLAAGRRLRCLKSVTCSVSGL